MMMTFGERRVFFGLSLRDIIKVLLLYCLKLTTLSLSTLLLPRYFIPLIIEEREDRLRRERARMTKKTNISCL